MLNRTAFLGTLILALALGTASFFIHQSNYPLTYDEGDYYVAVQQGLWTNWTDNDDISIITFAQMGIDAISDPGARARLSDYIRSSGSTMFHRHYHPPLAFYPAIALQPMLDALPLHEQLRYANLFWLFLWIAVLAVLGWLYEDVRSPVFLILPASAAWGMAVVGFNMHLPFGMLASLFLLCWYLYDRLGHRALRHAAQFFFAASCATVEYGMFLLFFIVLWGVIAWWRSDEKRAFLRSALAAAGWTLLFLALLWPAGVINANLAKSWTFVMYISLFRLGSEPVAFAGWGTLLLEKWNSNPVELLIMLGLLVSVLVRWRRMLKYGSLFTTAGFMLALLYLQTNPTLVYRWYLFPAAAVAFVLPAFVLSWRMHSAAGRIDLTDRRPSRRGWMLAAWPVLAIALFISSVLLVPEPDYTDLKAMNSYVRAAQPTHITLPRSLYSSLRPYLPATTIVSYHDVAYPDMAIDDSVAVWRAQGMTILPASTGIAGDTLIGEYVVIARNGKME
ncbi:hypothetical protein KQI65_00565 [bacterium]|nr:hypothetical protein [bacterium]